MWWKSFGCEHEVKVWHSGSDERENSCDYRHGVLGEGFGKGS